MNQTTRTETEEADSVHDPGSDIDTSKPPPYPTPDLFIVDGHVCFKQATETGPGILWALHSYGWEAFVDRDEPQDPFYRTGDVRIPTEMELLEAKMKYARKYSQAEGAADVRSVQC